jgi:hypothetical protein
MNGSVKPFFKKLGLLPLFLAVGILAGCDDSTFDREPPPGRGTLVVDNYTGDRLRVYVDGQEREKTSAGDHRYYDLLPGVHRVALDGDDVNRSWVDDIDILEGRRTVLEVRSASFEYDTYDTQMYFD